MAAGVAIAVLILPGEAQAQDRTLSFKQMHTGETLSVTYRRGNRYVADGLRRINHILRDWRTNEVTEIDPALLDIIWEVKRATGSRGPVHVLSAYRSPATNASLRSRGRGVAQQSQHTVGRALDFYLPDVPLSKLRETGLKFQRGGVGFYPSSGSPFVHLDTGSVRHWPRLPRQQLANLFPDGKTLHIPADGRPLPGYEQAKAEAARGVQRAVATTTETGRQRVVVARSSDDPSMPVRSGTATASASSGGGGGGGGMLAGLFGGGRATQQEAPAPASAPAPAPTAVASAPAPSEPSSPPPVPPARPTAAEDEPEPTLVAAMPEAPVPTPRPDRPAATADAMVADVPLPSERPIRTASTRGGSDSSNLRPSLSTGAMEALTALAPSQHLDHRLPFADTFVDAGPSARTATLVAPDQRPAALRPLVSPGSGLRTAAFVRLHRPDPSRLTALMGPAAVVLENSFGDRPAGPALDNAFRGRAVVPMAARSYRLANNLPRNGRLADLISR